jgi:hypothetical protein
VCATDRGPYEEKNARQQSEECVLGNIIARQNTNARRQMGLVLKLLVNFQKSGSNKAKEKNRKILWFNFFVCEHHNP